MDCKLRIAIDCRIQDARQGIGTAVLSLAKALSKSAAVNQEYTFIVREDMVEWLSPYIHGPCKLAVIPVPKPPAATPLSKVKASIGRIKPLQRVWHKLHGKNERLPVSNGFVESHEFDLVHFPTQTAYLTDVPSIYQPWDLQHLHYPQYFPKEVFALREREYRAFCDQARYVCVQAEWTRQDVIRQYNLPEEKVVVIPWGCVLEAYRKPTEETRQAIVAKYALPVQFFFYPAVAWPHKNHEVILRALHILKQEQGLAPHVFFSGRLTAETPKLGQMASELGVSEQVRFLGFLTPEELQVIFSSATAMIFPSKFEGFGLPILEAFHARTPVLSSNATTLPEVAEDAALYFDPDNAAELAELMKRVLTRPELAEQMITKGLAVLSNHSIDKTAACFQQLYQKITDFPTKGGRGLL